MTAKLADEALDGLRESTGARKRSDAAQMRQLPAARPSAEGARRAPVALVSHRLRKLCDLTAEEHDRTALDDGGGGGCRTGPHRGGVEEELG